MLSSLSLFQVCMYWCGDDSGEDLSRETVGLEAVLPLFFLLFFFFFPLSLSSLGKVGGAGWRQIGHTMLSTKVTT